uniref:Transcription initiation factor IIA subunit 1 n=3 Tax=Macrostomum lignano TaxID=282301 RepID=A0A1I8HNJ7_9PLAT
QQQQQQQHVKPEQIKLPQIDGLHSDDPDSDSELDDVEGAGGGAAAGGGEGAFSEEESLNSADDVSDEDSDRLFETDNIVVCQYDKINRARNKWKFHLKDGIMNLNGKDFVFQKATGDAEW